MMHNENKYEISKSDNFNAFNMKLIEALCHINIEFILSY